MSDSLFPEPALAGPAPVGLGRMMSGGGAKVARQGNDFYPTPANVTRALIAAEREAMLEACDGEHPVWEPCARGGAMLRVLNEYGFATIGTDLVADPENRVTHLELLSARRALSPVAMTNPPFVLAAPMIRHLLRELGVRYLAMLLKSSFWHAAERTGLWRSQPPQRIYALNWRPDFLNKGAPTMEVIWTVWDANAVKGGASGPCRFDVLGPAAGPMLDLGESHA